MVMKRICGFGKCRCDAYITLLEYNQHTLFGIGSHLMK
jgi:hypothetical protein